MTIDKLLDALTTCGWYVWDDFLSSSSIAEMKAAIPEDALQAARIGHQSSLHNNKNVRGDLTVWLDPDMGEAIEHYLMKMDAVRLAMNAALYMGLKEFETHFCRYPKGAFYQKHNDNPRAQSRRKITTVLYLNEDWQAGDGGELVVYDQQDNPLITLEPVAGRMVFFLSEAFPHEVLPTQTTRESIAGWFLN